MTTSLNTKIVSINNNLDDQGTYDPTRLLDALIKKFDLKNDSALARLLEVHPTVISKIRNYHLPIGPTLWVSMHEVSGLSIAELRAWMWRPSQKI